MKVFDSNLNKKWSGRGVEFRKSTLLVLKSADFSHTLFLKKGFYTVKILGKRRTGDGKFCFEILDSKDFPILKEEVVFKSSGLSEKIFELDLESNYGPSRIRITREPGFQGTLEINRLFVDLVEESKSEKAFNRRSWMQQRLKKSKTLPSKEKVEQEKKERLFTQKKICFIVPYGIYGGGEIYLQNLINQTDRHKITIIYLKENKLQNTISKPGVSHRVIKNLERLRGYLIAEEFNHIVYYNRLDVYQLLSGLKLDGLIQSKLIEIYHSDFRWSGSLSSLRERHGLEKFITVAPSLGLDISGVHSKQREVISTGIDLNHFAIRKNIDFKTTLGYHSDDKIIGTVARLSKEKNIDYVLSVAQELLDFKFIIVGDGPEKKSLIERIIKNKIQNVKLVGFKDHVGPYYNIMDGFLLASDIEGIPISILEAMASGVAVFSNMVGAIPDVIIEGETGYRISGENPVEDGIIIRKALQGGSDNLTLNARKYIEENHDIVQTASEFWDMIDLLQGIFILNDSGNHELVKLRGEFI